ncbi:hypothetical protein ACMWQB_30985, partial [Escherichia coli]
MAIWQASIGLAVCSAATTFRFSRLLGTLLGSFLFFTFVSGVYDLLTGHRGPWSDPLHVLEVIAALLI